jgi:hypothetical protein
VSRPDLPASGSAVALQLDYQRDIPRDRLVQTSVDEMRRLGASEAQLQRWEPELRRVFPDVKEGEKHHRRALPGAGCSLLSSRPPRPAKCADADFARLFFAIWLDPRSRSPDLRAALLKRPES